VADFRPAEVAAHKIKKSQDGEAAMTIRLARNPDILAAVRDRKAATGRPLITLGFAAETELALEHGREKLVGKGLDFIAVNDVGENDAGFEVETNRVTLLSTGGDSIELPLQSKTAVAERLIEIVAAALEYAASGATE
jgi:phosphopantothenoylcysteine decarboxylase/phosphopantothenate--cysteine ligase